ncbi:UNVERIFIED_CONTAM: hypothetical protein Slati_1844400 [Sesamum latifolium]|uniref:Uncharacterized protein n=1 Tax=Sesamum latifolium TaxID=2727402 RepID=A0AAW2X4E5_9LAMI
MRRRVQEIQDMRELEKKAEELQYKVDQEYGDGDSDNEENEETEEEKRTRVRKELEKVAREQAEQRKTAQLMFELGQKAYEKGTYGRAIEFLEAALTIIPRPTLLGGEVGNIMIPIFKYGWLWLMRPIIATPTALLCISSWKSSIPVSVFDGQAAELRYILQAPKLKISQEEMVTIPLIGSSYDSYAATWTDKNKDKDQRLSGSTTNQLPSTKDYVGDFLVWKPPVDVEKNRAFWASLTLWIGLLGAALFLQR